MRIAARVIGLREGSRRSLDDRALDYAAVEVFDDPREGVSTWMQADLLERGPDDDAAGHVPPGRHHNARLPAAWPFELALRVCPQQSRLVEALDPRVGNGGSRVVIDDEQGPRISSRLVDCGLVHRRARWRMIAATGPGRAKALVEASRRPPRRASRRLC